jgi:hypothetical protein
MDCKTKNVLIGVCSALIGVGVTAAGLYLTVIDELKGEKSKLEGEKSKLTAFLNNDEKLTYEEIIGLPKPTFLATYSLYLICQSGMINNKEVMLNTFNEFDRVIKKDDYISKDEIINSFVNSQITVPERDYILKLFDVFDSDNDGRLSKAEFGIV